MLAYNPNLLLVLSSTSFLYTSTYGFFKKNELFRIDMLNALASIAYWMEPDNMNKRAFDIVISGFTCISFFLHGYKYLPVYWRYVGYTNFGIMTSFFTLSCISYKLKYKKWYYFHFIFHTIVVANKLLVYNAVKSDIFNNLETL